jgi:hypothetical protein
MPAVITMWWPQTSKHEWQQHRIMRGPKVLFWNICLKNTEGIFFVKCKVTDDTYFYSFLIIHVLLIIPNVCKFKFCLWHTGSCNDHPVLSILTAHWTSFCLVLSLDDMFKHYITNWPVNWSMYSLIIPNWVTFLVITLQSCEWSLLNNSQLL